MKITFCGASGSVTGSQYLLETEKGKVIIDCGMFQGNKELVERNRNDFLFDETTISAVIVTHSHIDHIGLLPKLVKNGYNKKIYLTYASKELAEVLLLDSANIQKMDAEWENKRRALKDLEPIEPIYTVEDVNKTLLLFESVDFHKEFEPIEGFKVIYHDAGHIMGSSYLELFITENNKTRKIIFSGDLGHANQAIIKDPEVSVEADLIVIESTYGDRLHKTTEDTNKELVEILGEVVRTKGTLIIPAFAVGRTQEMIYRLFKLAYEHKIPSIKVYVDSPMAEKATTIYAENKDLYDEETLAYIKKGEDPLKTSWIKFTKSKDESKSLNTMPGPKIIISASGMCDAGRIQHHIKHNISNPNSHLLFVGYQAEGTLGRKIISGAEEVSILGDKLKVHARVHTVGGLSAHADRDELISWLRFYKKSNPKVIVVHGEPEISDKFADFIYDSLEYETFIPQWKDRAEIEFTETGINVKFDE